MVPSDRVAPQKIDAGGYVVAASQRPLGHPDLVQPWPRRAESLDVAHVGIYSAAGVEEISDERRNQYFLKTDAGYQILPEIRKMIVFAPHNLIRDAPFTRLNLVTCRNFLIYLGTKAQKKVLSLFHFGLKSGSVMFMGASESPGELGDEFETLNERAMWARYGL